jgi:hypothetical protein
MTVRIRGIYTTALTNRLSEVVQPSPAIAERFETSFDRAPAAAAVETTSDRQGVTVAGDPERVAGIVESLEGLGIDTLSWALPLPQDGVFAGEVVEELGSGAVVDVGPGEGFLPYGATSRRIETGDTLRVQVSEPRAPWLDGRPVLDTAVRIRGSLVSLDRGGTGAGGGSDGSGGSGGGGGSGGSSGSSGGIGSVGTGGPTIGDLLDAEPPEGWAPRWHGEDEDVPFDALAAALDRAGELATALDAALADADPPAEVAPGPYWTGLATTACWFGRESRFALDAERRAVTATMVGHHRIKAATDAASAAVDLVEAVCGGPGAAAGDGVADSEGDDHPAGDPEGAFPFDAVASQFGPRPGDRIGIGHGKPDGRCISLGSGQVTARRADGTVVVEREMSPGGTYDALGVKRQAGDVATTKFTEGRWWYPTVYRGEDGERRGTYVNVCTPVEIFPDTVRYVDLHVDVVTHADGTVERVDDDELDDAVAAGEVPAPLAEKARAVASAVERAL